MVVTDDREQMNNWKIKLFRIYMARAGQQDVRFTLDRYVISYNLD